MGLWDSVGENKCGGAKDDAAPSYRCRGMRSRDRPRGERAPALRVHGTERAACARRSAPSVRRAPAQGVVRAWQPQRMGLRLQMVTEGSRPEWESVETSSLVRASTKPIMASMMKKKRA